MSEKLTKIDAETLRVETTKKVQITKTDLLNDRQELVDEIVKLQLQVEEFDVRLAVLK